MKRAALAAQLPLAQPDTLKSEAARATLEAFGADVLVVVAYGLMVPPEVLGLPRFGCINLHASLLPRWRGAAPIQRALLAGDPETGVCVMQMDAGLDTGPVLLTRRIPISADDTGGSLHDELAALGAAALLEALEGLEAGTLAPAPQPAEGVTYAARISKAEALIDWSVDAVAIERQVRAFNPWPVAETHLDGRQLRIFAAHLVQTSGKMPDTASNVPLKDVKSTDSGKIVAIDREALIVQCGTRCLAVTQLQRPGGRVVGAGHYGRDHELLGRRLG